MGAISGCESQGVQFQLKFRIWRRVRARRQNGPRVEIVCDGGKRKVQDWNQDEIACSFIQAIRSLLHPIYCYQTFCHVRLLDSFLSFYWCYINTNYITLKRATDGKMTGTKLSQDDELSHIAQDSQMVSLPGCQPSGWGRVQIPTGAERCFRNQDFCSICASEN